MAEWLVEQGIGEARAALVEAGEIVAARIMPDGTLPAGTIAAARLSHIGQGRRNAIATLAGGGELLLREVPAGVAEGAAIHVELVREAIPGRESWKRPLGRLSDEAPRIPALAERLGDAARVHLLPFPPPPGADALEQAGWSDLVAEAASGEVGFAGGRLTIHPTPAMTLIDVDGHLPPAELAVAGAAAAARAVARLDLQGSIGIDLPTVAGKAARQRAADALDAALPRPFERTAINGFGFVQIVRRRARASLVEQYRGDRAGAEARALLRRAAVGRHGRTMLIAHPAVIERIERNHAWLDTLARQLGGAVRLRAEPGLAIGGGHAQPDAQPDA